MLRKMIMTVAAVAAVGLSVPQTAMARGGFGGGGFHGGGFHGGGFHAGGFGGGGFRAAAVGGSFRAMGPVGPRIGMGGVYGGQPGWHNHGHWRHGFWPGVAIGAGFGIAAGWPYDAGYYDPYGGYPYDYYDYDSYDGACYLVRQRVPTPSGWRIRRVQVCE